MKESLFIIAAIILITIGSDRLLGQDSSTWQYHQCLPGEKDYDPGHDLDLGRKSAGYDVALTIGADDWYDPVVLGQEANDWLKAAGVSYLSIWRPGTYAKNHLSALVGFRMRPGQQFEVCAYVNDLEGGHEFDGVVNASVGDTVRVSFRLEGETAKYILTHKGKVTKVEFSNFESAGRQVGVGPWHGGSSPAPKATGITTRFLWVE